MTISSQNRQAGPYLGNDVATAFTFAFKVFVASDLQVVRTDAAGVESTLTLTTDYTVSLNSNQDSNPGGTVTLVAGALVSGTKLTITSSIVPLQATDLTNQGGFYPKVITNALDKLTILIQQLFNSVGRQIVVPISDGAVNVNLPSAANRASKVLGFDALGGVAVYSPASAVTDAANVNFLQSGTGAVSRTEQDKNRERVTVKDFSTTAGSGATADTAAIQTAINSISGTKGKTVRVGDGSRISMVPGSSAAGVAKFEDLNWPSDATVIYDGPTRERVQHMNNFSNPYQVLPGWTTSVPVNEFVLSAPYHPGLVLDVKTKASYNSVVQPAHQFMLDYLSHGGTFDSSEQGSVNWRKDGVSTWSLIYGESKTHNLVFHKYSPAQKLYRLAFEATNGDVGIQRSTASYPIDVAGKMRLMQDVSTGTPVQSDNRSRFSGRPSFILEYKSDAVDNVATWQLEGSTGYQVGLNAPQNVDSAVQLTAYRQSDNYTSAVYVDGFYRCWAPGTDNILSLGRSAMRWSVVYAGTGTINTSDERTKQQIGAIDAAVLRAWAKVEFAQFKFKDAVQEKGDGARWHFGVIAQRVKEAFESEGLDAFTYGLLCYDEWDDEWNEWDDEYEVIPAVYSTAGVLGPDGRAALIEPERQVLKRAAGRRLITPAGNRYGIRYEEALVLECAYLRSKLQ